MAKENCHSIHKALGSRGERFPELLSMAISLCRTNIDVTSNQYGLHDLISYLCRQCKVPEMVSRSRHHRVVTVPFSFVRFSEVQLDDETMIKA